MSSSLSLPWCDWTLASPALSALLFFSSISVSQYGGLNGDGGWWVYLSEGPSWVRSKSWYALSTLGFGCVLFGLRSLDKAKRKQERKMTMVAKSARQASSAAAGDQPLKYSPAPKRVVTMFETVGFVSRFISGLGWVKETSAFE
jgi:hypothetical protein